MTDFVENFEKKEAEKKAARKTKKVNLEKFVEEDNGSEKNDSSTE